MKIFKYSKILPANAEIGRMNQRYIFKIIFKKQTKMEKIYRFWFIFFFKVEGLLGGHSLTVWEHSARINFYLLDVFATYLFAHLLNKISLGPQAKAVIQNANTVLTILYFI